MNAAIAGAKLLDSLGCFIDDLAGGGSSHEEAARTAGKLFHMLEEKHLLAGADKVFLGLTSLTFLGFLLKDGQVFPDPAKISAIHALIPPTTRTQLRGFLGLAGYYREFIHGFSKIAKPLTALLAEDHQWEWTPAC